MSDENDPIPQVPEHELRVGFHGLLQEARGNGGQLDPDRFWHFVGELARGRGIMERLHKRGQEFSDAEPPSPRSDHSQRRTRAYHRGVLALLLRDLDPEDGTRTSVLPGQFLAGVATNDLLAMGANPEAIPNGDPEILRAATHGNATMRFHARRAIVSYVHWKASRDNTSLARALDSLPRELPKSTWDGWSREFGSGGGEVAQRAKEAGARDEPRPPVWPDDWKDPDADETGIDTLLGIAKAAPGASQCDE